MCNYCNDSKIAHRYYNDVNFNTLVNHLSWMMEDSLFTENELHDAVKYASERVKYWKERS